MPGSANCLNIVGQGIAVFDGVHTFAAPSITRHGVVLGALANSVTSTAVGATGTVLAGNTGADPTFQTVSSLGGITTITGDSGGAESPSSGNFNFTGGTTGLTFAGTSATETLTGTLVLANGGTSASLTASNGGIFYSTASAGAILSGTATARQMLQSGTSAAPAWSTTTWPATSTVNQILYSSATNVISGITTAINGVLITDNSAGIPSILANGTAGFVLTANSGAPPSWQANTSLSWSVITANQTAAVNNGYICNKGTTLVLTLPTTSAVGDILEVTGMNVATGWQIAYTTNQQIFFGTSSTTITTGTLTSSQIRDSVRMVCIVANLTWQVLSSVGNPTVA